MITFTEKAATRILHSMKEENLDPQITVVRFGVKGGGCSGMSYTLDFDTRLTLGKFDVPFESYGLHIISDKKSLLWIRNTEVDWSDSLTDRGLKFNNPNARGSCGCRTSFMMEPPENVKPPTWMGM